jgi:hypothetical protein
MTSALNFPSNPTNGQQFTVGTRTFSWDGTAWRIYSTSEEDPVLTQEEIQDFVAPLFDHSSHSNITATYDDDNNKILLTAEDAGSTVTISETDPEDPIEGNIWYNSSIGKLFIYYDSSWVGVS